MVSYPYKGSVRRLRAMNPELDAAVSEMERQLRAVEKILTLISKGSDDDDPMYNRDLARLGIQYLDGVKEPDLNQSAEA